jgi:hypothetical protein
MKVDKYIYTREIRTIFASTDKFIDNNIYATIVI